MRASIHVSSRGEGQTCQSTAWTSSATVGGGAPRHTINMIVGGTTHATHKSARVPKVIDAPRTVPAPATEARTANQTPMIVQRFGAFDMMALSFRALTG
jgi:hypothetical protein